MEDRVTIEDQVRELMRRPLPAYAEVLNEGVDLRSPLDFLDALEAICGLLIRAECAIQEEARNLYPVIYVDYGASDELQTSWVQECLGARSPDRVLLYLTEGHDFLDVSGEIYATKVPFPKELGESFELTFACFRDEEAIVRDWEYSMGLYVARKSFSRQEKN